MWKANLFYTLTFLILMVYGGQVCPFLELLSLHELGLPLLLGLATASLARVSMSKAWIDRMPLLRQARWLFGLDLSLYAVTGGVLTIFNRVVYGFPVESGLKMLLGSLTLGLFFSTTLALERERQVFQHLAGLPPSRELLTQGSSLIRRMAWMTTIGLGLIGVDLMLILMKDLEWLTSTPTALADARLMVAEEIELVMVILACLFLLVLFSFSQNLKLMFSHQLDVLNRVAGGSLDAYVRVATDDELGVIASHTNAMIDGLRERERVRRLFGKMVSPSIAQQLMEGSDGELPKSQRRQVVVLFSDVRGFTRRAEASQPEAIVEDLNRYFTRMVEHIHAEGGIVDKFIGDGMMVVFGLDQAQGAASRAVRAGRAMLQSMPSLEGLSAPLEIGVGIHCGEVVAGVIGAPERLEFTCIGDTVNTAARLEAETRRLSHPLLISDAVIKRLEPAEQSLPWVRLGPQTLKGRAEPVEVYGLSTS